MGKIWAALGLALIAGCDSSDYNYSFRTVRVTVDNQGTQEAVGEAKEWGSSMKTSFSVAPGDTMTFDIVVSDRLKVHVERASDGAVLFDDFWDSGDLDKMDNQLTLTVAP